MRQRLQVGCEDMGYGSFQATRFRPSCINSSKSDSSSGVPLRSNVRLKGFSILPLKPEQQGFMKINILMMHLTGFC